MLMHPFMLRYKHNRLVKNNFYDNLKLISRYAVKDDGYAARNLSYIGKKCIISVSIGGGYEQRIIEYYPCLIYIGK